MERLQKFMARCGVASRRRCEEIIEEGKVKVNGKTVTGMGYKIEPCEDEVEVEGTVIKPKERKVYLMLNKPVGYVSTANDQFGRKTVLDLVKDVAERIYPVGRLDYDSEGLLLLTNDGDFTYRMTHPSHEADKEYLALVNGVPTEKELNLLRNGIEIEQYVTSPAKVDIVEIKRGKALLRITIHEGKNRQVRRMCDAVGYPVERLKRTAVGQVRLGSLKVGQWRYLTKKEIDRLME
ncbi:MAG: pseudouridine synthase [Bacillota bacterium]|nr:pseudouridine synthase [Bacillota bacterium]